MVRWILGCLGIVVVVGGGLVWFGARKYREFTSAGPMSTVAIQATPERIFASLANADSMQEWRSVIELTSTRRGALRTGDTLYTRFRTPMDTAFQRRTEVVTAVVPNRLLVLSLIGESSSFGPPVPPGPGAAAPSALTVMVRRDSLVPLGDSTLVVTTFLLPATDSLRATMDSARSTERRIMEVSSNLIVSVARMQAGREIRALKARIEGLPQPQQ